jgi:hypothetical protein
MAKRKPKPQGKCIFCDGIGSSKEHVWSDWLKDIMPGPTAKKHVHWGYRTNYESNPPTKYSNVKNGDMNQRKVRKVCKKCNNGWMGGIVEAAKPIATAMILDQETNIDRKSQTDLSAWIALATIMAEFNDPPTAAIPVQDRQRLLENHCPPDHWSIYIGRYSGKEWFPIRHRHIGGNWHFMVPGQSPAYTSDNHGLQLTTYTLGGFLVHVFSTTDPDMRQRFDAWPHHPSLFQLWPLRESLFSPSQLSFNWPLTDYVGDSDVESLSNDFYDSAVRTLGLEFPPDAAGS